MKHRKHSLRITRLRGLLSINNPGLDQVFTLLRTLPGGIALADHYQVSNTPTDYRTISYAYQDEEGYVMLEGTAFNGNDSLLPNSVQAHLSVGFYLGNFTPFFTLADKHVTNPTSHPHPIVNALLASRAVGQKSAVAGLSWRANRDTRLKAQYDHVINNEGSFGALGNIQPGFQPGGHYRLISVALEQSF